MINFFDIFSIFHKTFSKMVEEINLYPDKGIAILNDQSALEIEIYFKMYEWCSRTRSELTWTPCNREKNLPPLTD